MFFKEVAMAVFKCKDMSLVLEGKYEICTESRLVLKLTLP